MTTTETIADINRKYNRGLITEEEKDKLVTDTYQKALEVARNKAREWVKENTDYITNGEHFLSVCRKDDPENPLGIMLGTQYCAPESLIPILDELFIAELDAMKLVTIGIKS